MNCFSSSFRFIWRLVGRSWGIAHWRFGIDDWDLGDGPRGLKPAAPGWWTTGRLTALIGGGHPAPAWAVSDRGVVRTGSECDAFSGGGTVWAARHGWHSSFAPPGLGDFTGRPTRGLRPWLSSCAAPRLELGGRVRAKCCYAPGSEGPVAYAPGSERGGDSG